MTDLPRIISWSELKTIVPYSRQHILRLEAAGKFPVRVQVGANRIGWILSEVEGWIRARMAARKRAPHAANEIVKPRD